MPHHTHTRSARALMAWACVVVLGAGCAPKRPSDQTRLEVTEPQERAQRPVAVVRDEPVSAARLDAYIQAMPAAARARYASTERKQELLESIVTFEAMADDAETHHLDQTPRGRAFVLHELKEALARRALDAKLRESRALEIDREALQAAYDASYPAPAVGAVSRPVYAIKALGPELPRALREQVMAAPEADRLLTFRKLAARYSQDPASKERGGELGAWRSDQPLKASEQEPLRVAAMRLTPGAPSEPIEAAGAWWLLVTGPDGPISRPPLERVEREVREALLKTRRQRAREDLIASLRKDASITRDDAAIAAIKDAPTP